MLVDIDIGFLDNLLGSKGRSLSFLILIIDRKGIGINIYLKKMLMRKDVHENQYHLKQKVEQNTMKCRS